MAFSTVNTFYHSLAVKQEDRIHSLSFVIAYMNKKHDGNCYIVPLSST
ncbi:MAG: hypothetical protein K2M50_04720 [Treponemataceae bacterium]|nr:hypothetical protein [Treponemataceae bacterium]